MGSKKLSVEQFQQTVKRMKQERDWDKFHQPKDLLLGMVEEIGEFRNLVKWEQDQAKIKAIVQNPEKREHVVDFFSDMVWYLGSLAEYSDVDLGEAMAQIVDELETRFPIEKVKGTTANPHTGGYDGKYAKK